MLFLIVCGLVVVGLVLYGAMVTSGEAEEASVRIERSMGEDDGE